MRVQPYIIAAIGLLACASSQGASVRIDFGTSATAPTNGTWNSVTLNQNVADLLTENNTSSGISMAVTSNFQLVHSSGGSGFGGSTAVFGNDNWLQGYAALDSWIAHSTNPLGTIEFAGLNNSFTYRIDVVAAFNNNLYVAAYKVNGQYATITQKGTTGANLSQNWNQATAGTSQDWMVWEVTPVDGKITLEVIRGTTGGASLNALRITELTAIPEPSAFALVGGVAALGFVTTHRRRRS